MLQSKSNWKYTKKASNAVTWLDDHDEFRKLSPIIKQLLLQRDLHSKEEVQQFLSPDVGNLHSPQKMASIEEATERVHRAIEENEKILIFGDYDADGVSSTTVMLKTLQELGANCDYYIPNRFTEGYGPNEAAFTEAYKRGFTLIITVDTGISAVHEADIAKQLGIDLIITDHHEAQHTLPDAYAILHPKCSPDYPFKELAGVGVAFKFAERLLGYFPKHLLEFVAIGTVADLVPLVDENRILVYHGLHALTNSNNPGIRALKKVCKIEGNVTEEDIGFSIGPRINAVGRLQDADLAVQLLMIDRVQEAELIAEEIQEINSQRQQIVNEIVIEAEEILGPDDLEGVIVVAKEGWNEGVLGIVASKLVRKYDRPAIVLTIKPETKQAKGSARSIPAFDLFSNCMNIRELFTSFGGHAQAAGMTLPLENLHLIRQKLSESILHDLSEEDFKQEIEISSNIPITDINIDLINDIAKLAPFGMKNPKPIFQVEEIPTEVRQIGSAKNHLKLQFKKESTLLDGVGFGMGELFHYISPKTPIKLVGELSINEWNGLKKAQIMVQDMQIDTWQLFDQRGRKHVDFLPYENQTILVLENEQKQYDKENCSSISYQTDVHSLTKVEVLYIRDLPEDLSQLKEIIEKTNPYNIHVCYTVEDSAYLKTFPQREEFIWYYALIKKQKTLDLKRNLQNLMQSKGWSKDRIIFMSNVFFELGFVTIKNGVIYLNPSPEKRDLSDSTLYSRYINQIEVEKTLYYSNYEVLKDWIENSCMSYLRTPKEEVIHGL
ncbi:single-stranded-DNA-specific exonuclease RecJ [Oceanobacillus bengalensis]|uniref:Single-stranded-DNA-specific exonuclease RecJ n=1 Tax=Oceanobacillus bengalensis TaxID=1435466 RepID=A0A494Z606_9BACI|nr:single-stranded-DNA-specific exonuclease RecJ [Oceanobacillus bengalensis]RKQ17914.1 single-stranded-DNA-specific exonuclease RecJ [Oceanobacillus bengalensis]